MVTLNAGMRQRIRISLRACTSSMRPSGATSGLGPALTGRPSPRAG